MIDLELQKLMRVYAGKPIALKIRQLLSADCRPIPWPHKNRWTITIPGKRWVYENGELVE